MKKLLLFVGALASAAYAQKAPRIQSFQELVKAPKEGTHAISSEKILGVTLGPMIFLIRLTGQLITQAKAVLNLVGMSMQPTMVGGLTTALPPRQGAITPN